MPQADARRIINAFPFVKNHGIEIVAVEGGVTRVQMPYDETFCTVPGLFPTAMVGLVGDVAAVGACFAAAPEGFACATLDFTVKNTGLATGEMLCAEGRALMTGKTISVGSADIYVMNGSEKRHCGTVLATARVYKASGDGPSNLKE